MADLDLDAIQKRAENAANVLGGDTYKLITTRKSAEDVPGLVAEVRRLRMALTEAQTR